MSSATRQPAAADNVRERDPLRVSAYDRVSSLLVALIILIGFFVAIMGIIWLTKVLTFKQEAVPITLVEDIGGRGEHAQGYEREMEEPGLEELEELTEPQLEATLEAITDVVTTQAAALDQFVTDAVATSRGTGLGDARQAGPGGEGDTIPRWERWQVRFTTDSPSAYARQLDYFGIELAAVGGGRNEVDYAFNLSKSQPDRRSGPSEQEKRLYMTWTSGTLSAFDRQLLQRAGIDPQGRIVLQFYPPEVENRMAQIELEYARGRTVEEIQKTIFGVRGSGGGYEFYVIQQQYRPAPPSPS